ncbi:MAG TPA: (5-formylfuran-3-yl)methyl phosphate synthase [Stellaceae bacterium]|nr:(5-formylfuran-3-yl)methyl phosphate synthase [Stellaceae bacterium]
MSRFLASVRSAVEAEVALAGGADIIDAKEPAMGALGRVPPAVLRAIVARVAGRVPVSATIGDVELSPDVVRTAVAATSKDGADIVKIGVFPGDLDGSLRVLRPVIARGIKLVAVLFADRAPDLVGIAARCAEAGFFGVMLDTAGKSSGALIAHQDRSALAGFVARARSLGLVSGLAGSLRLGDIPELASLGADYLGFRSALTAGGRQSNLDPAAVRAVRQALDRSSATAAAGAMSATSPARESVAATAFSKLR